MMDTGSFKEVFTSGELKQLRQRVAELESENEQLHQRVAELNDLSESIRDRNTYEQRLAAHERTNSSYKNLTTAQESQLTALRQRLYSLKEADKQLDSERQANALLTKRIAYLESENTRLTDLCYKWNSERDEYLDAYIKALLGAEVVRINGNGMDIEWNPLSQKLPDGTPLYALKDKP